MSDSTPHRRNADDAHADHDAPTDAVTDEVKADAVRPAENAEAGADTDSAAAPPEV